MLGEASNDQRRMKMQAQLARTRFPTNFVRLAVALLAAVLLGAALGYALKPATIVASPNDSAGIQASGYSCEFVDKHKAC
jgi:F0F1-type ATP synthase assembly protein I